MLGMGMSQKRLPKWPINISCSTSLGIEKIQIKITINKVLKLKNKCWWKCGIRKTPIHC